MSSKVSMQLQSALIATGLVQPVSEKNKGGHIEVLCRQIQGQEKPWLVVIDRLLQLGEELGEDFHVCRRYVRKNGQMVFGWHLAFTCKSAKALQTVVDSVVKGILEEARPSLQPEPAVAAEPEAPAPVRRQPMAPGRHPPPQMAPPRPPGAPGAVIGTPPPTVGLRVVQNSRDERGKITIVEEMPLPHVYAEMNRPNEKGKGAKLTGGG